MKNTSKLFLIIASLFGLFTISCGDNFSESQDGSVVCVYAGVLYTTGQEWRTVDGRNVCTCGFSGQVLCSQGDGGVTDGMRVGDASGDLSAPSDGLTPPSDALEDGGHDASPADVPVGSDGKTADAARDASVSDSRLAAERD
jgi:hypothetical protein